MCKGPEAETCLMGKGKAGVLSVRERSDVGGELVKTPRDGKEQGRLACFMGS